MLQPRNFPHVALVNKQLQTLATSCVALTVAPLSPVVPNALGTRVEAVVKAVKEMQLNVTLAPRVHGRVHITEMEDTSLDMDLNAPSPLAAFKVGDAIEARVVGLHNIKTHKNLAITHKWNMKTMIDCSMKPSKLALKAGKPFPAQLDATSLKTGAKCVAYVQKVTNTEVIVCVTPRVLGRIPALLASTDAKVCTWHVILVAGLVE